MKIIAVQHAASAKPLILRMMYLPSDWQAKHE